MKYLVCKSCKRKISSIADIVNMTNNGTSSLYVNTGIPQFCYQNWHECSVGYIHEMVTVKSVLNFVTRGRPTAERSWFEGYSFYRYKQIRDCVQVQMAHYRMLNLSATLGLEIRFSHSWARTLLRLSSTLYNMLSWRRNCIILLP